MTLSNEPIHNTTAPENNTDKEISVTAVIACFSFLCFNFVKCFLNIFIFSFLVGCRPWLCWLIRMQVYCYCHCSSLGFDCIAVAVVVVGYYIRLAAGYCFGYSRLAVALGCCFAAGYHLQRLKS